MLVLSFDEKKLYEVFSAYKEPNGWKAASGAVFDLTSNKLRPAGWTSADAAGLPVFAGLVRYDETIEQGEIRHALRFAVKRTQRGYIPPATHWASRSSDRNLPPMGLRVRLRADYDTSKFPRSAQVIFAALKKHGMILADNGGDWFINGAPHPKWNDEELSTLKRVKGADLEAVYTGELVTRCPGIGWPVTSRGGAAMSKTTTRTLAAVLMAACCGPAMAQQKLFGMRGFPRTPGAEVAATQPAAKPLTQSPDYPASFLPFIDAFGQYKHGDWPGKINGIADLAKAREAEQKELAANPGPSDWDQYGGWKAGPALKATGFFRTEKHNGRWWLVDPEGRLFWSHGIDCVNNGGDGTPIEERESWFEQFPGQDPAFASFLRTGRCIIGHYKDRTVKCFDFAGANLKRKYGDEWAKAHAQQVHARLRSWGLNTIANWSAGDIYLMKKTPYVGTVHFSSKPIQGSTGYWGQFKDPFDPDFAAKVGQSMAREKNRTAGDPWCIGYFVDNEIAWGDEVALPLAALASPADQAAKRAFVEDLTAKYKTIEALNAAWDTQHASWPALLESRTPPDKAKARDDLRVFTARIAEQYFKGCREAVKAAAPNQLYLGCRFAWSNAVAVGVSTKFCDVVSFNVYNRNPNVRLPADADVPTIIGEFHFGALDRGMFHPGLVLTKDQGERAAVYKQYITAALKDPRLVGTHWFQYRDQPATGRPLDGENYQIGFVDIGDTPYPETIAACREVGGGMYRLRSQGP